MGGLLLLFAVSCSSAPDTPTSIANQAVETAVSPELLPTTILVPTQELATITFATAVNPPATATPFVVATHPPFTPEAKFYFPWIVNELPVATGTPVPPATAVPTPTLLPPLDFAALRSDLSVTGQELAYVKIGFHVGVGGRAEGLEAWMRELDAAGIPFFLKSVENAQPILFAQDLMRQSGVPHTLVFRKVSSQDYDFDVPNYSLPPQEAAQIHWDRTIEAFPPELDPSMVWLETINEVDKNQAEWLGQFALTTSELALRDGFKWAAFGWSSGEPEPEHWETPSMLAFLRVASQYPDQIAVALHEYSYVENDIGDAYPYKVGRFQTLFQIADKHGIPRPTVLITEWGWEYQNVPDPEQALADIAWASRLYAPYPQVKGAAIWYLGNGFADIADQTQRLIRPLHQYTIRNYYPIPAQAENIPIQPELYTP